MFGIKTANAVCKSIQHYSKGWATLAKGYEIGSKYRANISILKEAGKYSKELSKLQQKYPNLSQKDLELIK